jgi:hydrogenase nickel incorporation protein HypA/HybF
MHELSLAEGILRVVTANLRSGDPADVSLITVRIGRLSCVSPESLSFCFDAIKKETPLVNAELDIVLEEAEIECCECGATSRSDGYPLVCPECYSTSVRVERGKDLQVDSFVLEEKTSGENSKSSREPFQG